MTFGAPYHDKYISKFGKHCQKMIPFLGFLDYKENIRLNITLFCQLAHRASCGQVQLARPTVYLPRAIGQPRISTPALSSGSSPQLFLNKDFVIGALLSMGVLFRKGSPTVTHGIENDIVLLICRSVFGVHLSMECWMVLFIS